MAKKPDAEKKGRNYVKERRLKNVESSLKLERTANLAIAKAFVRECPNPERLLARLDGMVRAAMEDEYMKPEMRQVLIAGRDLVARAIEQEQGKPQGLFDPDVGHISPRAVNRIVDNAAAPTLTSDIDEHRRRREFERTSEDEILRLIREHGALTDEQLLIEYMKANRGPKLNAHNLYYRRTALVKRGQLAKSEQSSENNTLWDTAERVILKEGRA